MNLTINNLRNKLLIALVLSFMFLSPIISFAQTGGLNTGPILNGPTGVINNPIPKIKDINGLIKTILEGFIKIGIPLIALAIIYSGFLFIMAQGKEEKLTEAKNALLYTMVGAAVLLGSWALAQLISETVLAL